MATTRPRQYAEDTEVTVQRSQAEIAEALQRYGAADFITGTVDGAGLICFKLRGRAYQIRLPLPTIADDLVRLTSAGKLRPAAEIPRAIEQANRCRWRVFLLHVKALIESDRCLAIPLEEALLAYVALPGGGTVGQEVLPRIEAAYASGRRVPLLPAPEE